MCIAPILGKVALLRRGAEFSKDWAAVLLHRRVDYQLAGNPNPEKYLRSGASGLWGMRGEWAGMETPTGANGGRQGGTNHVSEGIIVDE